MKRVLSVYLFRSRVKRFKKSFRAYVRTSPSIKAQDKKSLFKQIDMLALLQKQLASMKKKVVEDKLNNLKDNTSVYEEAKKDLDSLFNEVYDYLTQSCRKSGDDKLEDKFYNLMLVNRNKSKTDAEIDSMWKEVKNLVDTGFKVVARNLSYHASLKILS